MSNTDDSTTTPAPDGSTNITPEQKAHTEETPDGSSTDAGQREKGEDTASGGGADE